MTKWNYQKNISTTASPIMSKYMLKTEDVLEEFGGAKAQLFVHKNSGAELLSVESTDDNKVFGVTFKTPPSRSDGVAHILEHSVLCGSRKYPIKEPFVELMKGSMNTFLNAFTYPDRTCYPVASTNLQDFYNLVDVYLDAVFFPNLTPLTFAQEGWHYEVDKAKTALEEQKDSKVMYTGVVFNEMKGVYSQPDALLGRYEQQALFPDNCYHVDSGGDPQVIPQLTFDEFNNFHQTYYHPSNAKVFFYGDDPIDRRLEIADEYFNDVLAAGRLPSNNAHDSNMNGNTPYVNYQKKHVKPLPSVRAPYALNDNVEEDAEMMMEELEDGEEHISGNNNNKGKHFFTLNWVVNDEPLSLEEMMELSIVNYLLLGTSGSILYRKLMSSNYGSSVTGGGLSEELLQHTFSVGLKGVKEENLDKISELILYTMEDVATNNGFTENAIEAALNTLEFQLRELNSGGIPRGLALMLSINPGWLYHGNPFDSIKYNPALKSIRTRLSHGERVFENALKKYLVNNQHRVEVNLYPDVKHGDEIQAKEEQELNDKQGNFTNETFEEIRKLQEDLDKHQATPDTPEALRCIPSLKVKDMRTEILKIPKELIKPNDTNKKYEILLHEQEDTNGIVYVDCMIPIRGIKTSDLPLLPILTRCLTETGTNTMDVVEFIENIGTHTGGIGTSVMINPVYKNMKDFKYDTDFEDDFEVRLVIRGKATEGKVSELLSLMSASISNANFNLKTKILEIFNENYIGMESALVGSGHSIGSSMLSSNLKKSLWVKEQFSGLKYYLSMKDQNDQFMSDDNTKSYDEFHSSLVNLHNNIIDNDDVLLNITGSSNGLKAAMEYSNVLFDNLPMSKSLTRDKFLLDDDWKFNHHQQQQHHAIIIPSQVNYICQGGFMNTDMNNNERLKESTKVVTRHIQNNWLWDEVRVKGNAYGAFCSLSSSGIFSYGSYRDPRVAETFNTYDNTATFLNNENITEDQLEKAIIGYMSDQDSPSPPSSKGYNSALRHLLNITDEARQIYRDEVLNTNVNDFNNFSNNIKDLPNTGIKIMVGSENAFNEFVNDAENNVKKEEWKVHNVL